MTQYPTFMAGLNLCRSKRPAHDALDVLLVGYQSRGIVIAARNA
jgi:hypothetical protein